MTTCQMRKPKAPNHYWTEDERDIVRREYCQTSVSKNRLASLLNVTPCAVAGQIAHLGLAKRTGRRPWKPEEDDYLRELIHRYSPYSIARRMGRSLNSVVVRSKRLHLSSRVREGWFTKKEVCDLLGLDHKRVQQFINSGALKATYHSGVLPQKTGSALWHIAEKALRNFIIRYCQEFNGRNVDLILVVDLLVGLPPVRSEGDINDHLPLLLVYDDGSPVTEREVYRLIREHKAQGHRYFSSCNSVDADGLCTGHPAKKVNAGPRPSPAEPALRLQGLPEDLLDDAPFTLKGKHGVIGNAVAYPMAQELAKAVKRATNDR